MIREITTHKVNGCNDAVTLQAEDEGKWRSQSRLSRLLL